MIACIVVVIIIYLTMYCQLKELMHVRQQENNSSSIIILIILHILIINNGYNYCSFFDCKD